MGGSLCVVVEVKVMVMVERREIGREVMVGVGFSFFHKQNQKSFAFLGKYS